MKEIFRCVICEFIGMYHIVPTMIHWLYTVHANSIKYKMRRRPPRRRLIQNLHKNNVNLPFDCQGKVSLLILLVTKQT